MRLGQRILSLFGYRKGIAPVNWMSWTGNCNSPAFNVSFDNMAGYKEVYNRCSPVSAIINRLASSMANGKWWLLDEHNNDVSTQKRFLKISNLLKRPNPLQTRTEFVKQLDTYRNLYGVTYVYAVLPLGFKNIEDAKSLWPINPERIEPIYKNNIIYEAEGIEDIIEKYVITIGNEQIEVNPKHILTIGQRGNSCLNSLHSEISSIMQAQEANLALLKDRGALGIISNRSKDAAGSIPLTSKEKDEIQEQYKTRYGIGYNQAKVIISDADLHWQQMSFNVKDLMLIEGITQNTKSVAGALNYPHGLFANEGETYKNRPEDIKYLYQDNIIPASNIYEEKFSEFLGLEGARIEIDFSEIEYLREAEKERAEALLKLNQALQIPYMLGVITLEEYREAIDLDQQPKGNTYYMADNGNKSTEAN